MKPRAHSADWPRSHRQRAPLPSLRHHRVGHHSVALASAQPLPVAADPEASMAERGADAAALAAQLAAAEAETKAVREKLHNAVRCPDA